MAVFIQHSNSIWIAKTNFYSHIWLRVVKMFFFAATDGVSFFFVLSGFLITYLIINEKGKTGKINILYFYIRRSLRIWPLYYLLVLLEFTALPTISRFLHWEITTDIHPVYAVTFLSNFNFLEIARHGAMKYSLLGTSWSVSVEEQFYLILPLLFYFIPQKAYKFIFPAIIIACYCSRIAHWNDGLLLYFHTFSLFGDLAVGGLLGYYVYSSKTLISWLKNLSRPAIIAIYVVGFLWLFYASQVHHNTTLFIALGRFVNCVLFAFIIAEQCFCERSFFKLSNNKFASKWGKYTYGLYLLHTLGIMITYNFAVKFFPAFKTDTFINELLFRLVALFIAMTISYMSYEFYEKQFLKLKEKFAIIKTKSLETKQPFDEKIFTATNPSPLPCLHPGKASGYDKNQLNQ
jgi:peptidoglycan/LPS O-acetylase OafA/YrhL